MADPSRRSELQRGLRSVAERVSRAAAAAGRDAAEVTLVVVTKTWPASDIRLLHELGVRDFGESRHPEAETKAQELADLTLTWHFVGQIQSNKAAKIARYAHVVHSIDSVRIAQRLNTGAHQGNHTVDCLVQVSLDPAHDRSGRGGVRPDDLEAVAQAIDSAGMLRLLGVMGIAPMAGDALSSYRRLADAGRRLRAVHPDASAVSAGMSGDFEAAISAGATHVRVGSAVLGERPPLR